MKYLFLIILFKNGMIFLLSQSSQHRQSFSVLKKVYRSLRALVGRFRLSSHTKVFVMGNVSNNHIFSGNKLRKFNKRPQSIVVGCIPPTCQPYLVVSQVHVLEGGEGE